MACRSLTNGRSLWTFSLGITFVCCSLITYNLLCHYEIISTPQSASSNSHLSKSAKLSNENCRTLCTTNECIEIANYILHSMNLSANPCDDFSNYACGNFREQFGKQSNHSIFETLTEKIYIVLKDIIETSEETQITGSGAQKLKIVYDSCMDSKSSDLSTFQSMLQFLNQMGMENWPHLSSNFSFTYPTFEEVVGKLASYQEDIFLRFYIRSMLLPSQQDQDVFNISVAPQNPTFDDHFEIKELKKVITGILHYTGMDNKDINKTWEEFIEVENGLSTLLEKNSEESADCEDEEGEMVGKDSLIDCTHRNASENMVCQIWNSVIRNGRLSIFHGKERIKINCKYMHYIDKLPKLLKSFHDRALAHYIALRVVINNLKYMSFSIRKTLRFFIKKPLDRMLQDHAVDLDRGKFCVSWITDNMKWPLGLMYVNRMWKKEAVDELDDIVNDYKKTIVKLIKEQEWIDEKSQAIEQTEEVKNAVSKVIEWLRNRTKIDTDYRRFRPSRKNFFRNIMHHKKFQFTGVSQMTLEDLILQDSLIFTVNAFGGGENIDLAFGILLPPVFKYGYPKLFNYAKIGQIVGHEIGHKLIWTLGSIWEGFVNETRQRFFEKMNCLVDQYFSYELKRIKQNVNGNETFGENFSDNMAIIVTEKAAEKLIRDMEKNNFSLPGLSFSPEELLYISYAQAWCETRSIEKEYDYFERDNHSPPEYRIIGNLQNSARFSEVFHCPSTSYMNPNKKCLILD